MQVSLLTAGSRTRPSSKQYRESPSSHVGFLMSEIHRNPPKLLLALLGAVYGSAALQDSVASIRGIHTYRHLCVIEKYDRGQGLPAVASKVEA